MQDIENHFPGHEGQFGVLNDLGGETVGIAGYGSRQSSDTSGGQSAGRERRAFAVQTEAHFATEDQEETGNGIAAAKQDRALGLADRRRQAQEPLFQFHGWDQVGSAAGHFTPFAQVEPVLPRTTMPAVTQITGKSDGGT